MSVDGKLVKTSAYYLAFIVIGMCVAILGPTLPDLARNTRSPISHLSFLFTARALGYLIGAYLGGRIYDEVKGHPVMGGMLIATALFLALIPQLEFLGVLIFVILLLGITESVVDVGGNTLLVWIHRDKVSSYMNGLHFFFGVGGFLAPFLVAQVVKINNNFSWSYWVLSAIILPLAVLVFLIPSPSPKQANEKYENGSINWLLVGSVILFFFLWVGAEAGFSGWIYTYALQSGLADKTVAAYLTSAFWGAFTIARLISVLMALTFKPVQILFSSVVGTMGSLLIIVVYSDSYYALLFGTIGVGVFMASVFPTTLSFAERRMVLTGRITSFFFIGAGIGGMSLPWMMGQYIESTPTISLAILIGNLAFALLVLLWITLWLRPKIIARV
ncbi:MAG: MFS transporter [Proteobacteria bacterium]|nr:MFS transporter [Pseudomonadota bacterium]